MRLTDHISALLGGRRAVTSPRATAPPAAEVTAALPPATLPPATLPPATPPPATLPPATLPPATLPPATLPPATLPPATEVAPTPVGGPSHGPGAAAGETLDPCAAARAAVHDACALAERMNALAVAIQDRHREARRAYDEHAGRRERAKLAEDPRMVRAAKEEAQAAFRRARRVAADRAAVEAAATEWLREIDRINARTRDAQRIVKREDAAEHDLLRAVERVEIEADGARIAAESAAEACRNARIALANCEETDRLGAADRAAAEAPAPAPMIARPAIARAAPGTPPDLDRGRADDAGDDEAPAPTPSEPEPAVLPLVAGDRAIQDRIATALAAGDRAAVGQWQAQLEALVAAIRERAIDSAALVFPEEHPFWGPHTQAQCREIAAALAALGYRYDGVDGFADGRIPGQRELSLAIGYAGLDPMRVRIWPTEAELPHLMGEVRVDAGRFLAEAAGELTLGEMIDLLGRRADDLSDLWNAWGRVRPLLLSPA